MLNYFSNAPLARQIERFLKQSLNLKDYPQDGESTLKAIEAQHGILVERAHGIYSFSHLTFQEYFTAQFLATPHHGDALNSAVVIHLMDPQWTEVFLLTASLIDNPETFLELLFKRAATEGKVEHQCHRLISWAGKTAFQCKETGPATRFYLLFNVFFHSLRKLSISSPDLPGTKALNKNIGYYLDTCCGIALACSHYLAYHVDIDMTTIKTNARQITAQLSRDLGIKDTDYPNWNPYVTDARQMATYMSANELIVECLKLSALSNRGKTESKLLTFDI